MIKLLTYNVNFAGARSHELEFNERTVIAAIADADADVVVLQETHVGWERVLDTYVDYPYRWFHDESIHSAGGLAILSRVPFRTPTVIFPKDSVSGSWFPAAFTELTPPASDDNDAEPQSVWLGAIHLRPPVYDVGKANLMTMTNTSPIRKAELTVLLDAMAAAANCPDHASFVKQHSVIIAGDVNENCNHSACQMMAELGFHDAIADVPGNTHWWPIARVPLSASTFLALKSRLDHVFFSGRLAATATTVDHRYEGNASDHLPVVVTFQAVSDAAQMTRPVKVSQAWTMLRVGFVQVHPESIWVN